MVRASLSAVVPTKNVAGFIRPTLDSLQFCDEVVIIDMFSTDETRPVCESYPNVRFYQRDDYIYGNFNHGVGLAAGDWIVRIDSDEVISPELQVSIEAVLTDPEPAFLHYDAFCHLYFFGMRLRHGFGDQWRTMLFKKGSAGYQVRSEHEGLTVAGPPGKLRGHYDHFTNPTLSAWWTKILYYIEKDMERAPIRPPLTPWRVVLNSARWFRGAYWGKGKLRRDGYLGFTVALCTAFALALIELENWERYEKAKLRATDALREGPSAS